MADFILNDLDIKCSNIPIEFDLQFDIDRKKIINKAQFDNILLEELQEINYYNMAVLDEENFVDTNSKIDLMKEFESSFEVFALENASI